MAKEAVWFNDDGLAVKYGTHSADNDTGHVYQAQGSSEEELRLDILLIDVPTSAELAAGTAAGNSTTNISAAGYFSNAPVIPANSVIISAIATSTVAATSGGSAVLNVGTFTMGTDGLLNNTGGTEDPDGICNATDGALANFASLGDAVECTGALITGSVGGHGMTVGTEDVIIAPTATTADFTAGEVSIVVKYRSGLSG